jgi:hypothetical protein
MHSAAVAPAAASPPPPLKVLAQPCLPPSDLLLLGQRSLRSAQFAKGTKKNNTHKKMRSSLSHPTKLHT